jgi:hypothetical protein
VNRHAVLMTAMALAVLTPIAASAVPVKYDLVFEAPTPGSGSFLWDEGAGTITDFGWDFGAGVSGALRNEINWLAPVFGSTRGRYFFELITGENAHPSGCDGIDVCSASYLGNEVIGFPSVLANFSRDNQLFDSARYFFLGADSRILSGNLLATRAAVSVSEAGTLAMLTLGLLALLVVSRVRTRECTQAQAEYSRHDSDRPDRSGRRLVAPFVGMWRR